MYYWEALNFRVLFVGVGRLQCGHGSNVSDHGILNDSCVITHQQCAVIIRQLQTELRKEKSFKTFLH